MEFNINRFTNLIRRDFISYKKPLLLGSASIIVFMLLATAKYLYTGDNHPGGFLCAWFIFGLIAGGLLLTSVIFWEFKSSPGRVHFLGIPASHFEKVLSRWLYTFLLFPVFLCLIFGALYLGLSPFVDLTTNSSKDMIQDAFTAYWITHPIVFMFSIWYNRYVAPKSVLTALGFLLLMALLFFILHRLFFHDLYDGIFSTSRDIRIDVDPKFQGVMENKVGYIFMLFGYVLFPLFFLVVSYFKMKEKEA